MHDEGLGQDVERLLSAFPPPWSHPRFRAVCNYLTNRELEVLNMIAYGKTNIEIGKALFISPVTVREHTKKIHAKSEIRGRSRLAVAAYKILAGGYDRESSLMRGENK